MGLLPFITGPSIVVGFFFVLSVKLLLTYILMMLHCTLVHNIEMCHVSDQGELPKLYYHMKTSWSIFTVLHFSITIFRITDFMIKFIFDVKFIRFCIFWP